MDTYYFVYHYPEEEKDKGVWSIIETTIENDGVTEVVLYSQEVLDTPKKDKHPIEEWLNEMNDVDTFQFKLVTLEDAVLEMI